MECPSNICHIVAERFDGDLNEVEIFGFLIVKVLLVKQFFYRLAEPLNTQNYVLAWINQQFCCIHYLSPKFNLESLSLLLCLSFNIDICFEQPFEGVLKLDQIRVEKSDSKRSLSEREVKRPNPALDRIVLGHCDQGEVKLRDSLELLQNLSDQLLLRWTVL